MEIISIIFSSLGLLCTGASAAFFVVVKFNDLKHQEEALKRIETNLGSIDAKLDINAERISKIEGKCAANHGA